jgi:hypothetical protein
MLSWKVRTHLTKCALRVFSHPMPQSPILGPLFVYTIFMSVLHTCHILCILALWLVQRGCSGFRDCNKRFYVHNYKIRKERELRTASRPRESLKLSISGSLCVFKQLMEAEGREGRGGDQRKEMRRRVIMGVLASTLYQKFETYIPRN